MRQRTLQRIYTGYIRKSEPTFESIFNANFSHTEFPLFEWDEDDEIKTLTYPEVKRRIRSLAFYIEKNVSDKGQYIGLN